MNRTSRSARRLASRQLADGQLIAASAGDVLGQRVANDLAVGLPAVEIKPQTAGPARAVVGHRHVNPPVERDCHLRLDPDRIAGPEMDQVGAHLAFLYNDPVTT